MSANVTVENLAQHVRRLDPGGVLLANLGHVIQVEERELSHFGFTSSLLDSFHTLKKSNKAQRGKRVCHLDRAAFDVNETVQARKVDMM